MSITYTATLPVRDQTVFYLSKLLHAERQRRGTRNKRRTLSCFKQSVLVLRWLMDGTRMSQLVSDNNISTSTGYAYLNEAITVLAAQAPGLHSALLAAKAAGYDYVLLDGTLIETDRVSTPGPTAGVDLWWSAKHKNHGGNIQVLTAPDGWPLWTSPVRPGREHDTTCLRTHPTLLDTLAQIRDDLRTLTDLGYEGEADTVVVAFKKPKNGELTDHQQTFNRAHNRLRAVGERGNSLLKMTFKALRNVTLCPWKIGDIVAAALVILHIEHDRTT
jgi:DDE superfamily endonuclease